MATDRVTLSNGAFISTEAEGTNGGDIQIDAERVVRLQDSKITASVEGGARTTGGNITLNAKVIVLRGSEITTQASQDATGGNIQLIGNGFLADTNSLVDASSALGIDGTVEIETVTDLSGDIIPLTTDFIQLLELRPN